MVDGALGYYYRTRCRRALLKPVRTSSRKGFVSATVQNAPSYVENAVTAGVLGLRRQEPDQVRRDPCTKSRSADGQRRLLIPVHDWKVRGDPNPTSWLYDITMAGPDRIFTQTVPAEVASYTYTLLRQTQHKPWSGIGPLQSARIAGKLSAGVNHCAPRGSHEHAEGWRGYCPPRGGRRDFGIGRHASRS